MFHNPTEIYLFVLLGVFLIPYLVWRFAKTDSYAPLPIVQIILGVIFGPGIFGYFFPSAYNTLFTSDTIKMTSGVATLAVVMFVFTAGLEVNLKCALNKKKDTLVTASLALCSPLFIGSIVTLFLSLDKRWLGPKAHEWQFVLSVGMATAVTALPILVLLLEKMNILKSEIGARCLRYASFDDIAIWTVFALILLDWNRLARQGIFFLVFILFSVLIIKYSDKIPQKDRIHFSIFWLIFCAYLSDWSGLHYLVGGFLAGMVLEEEWIGKETLENLRKYILLLIMPVFFLSTGLKTGWKLNDLAVVYVAVILFVCQAFGKIFGVSLSAKILKWPTKDAKIIGWLLQTKALIEIIFCTVMLDKGIISSEMFTALLFMAILSTMATTPVVSRLLVKNKE